MNSDLHATASLDCSGTEVRVVGVCARKVGSYASSTIRAAEQLSDWSRHSHTISAGDFNQSASFKRAAGHNFSDSKDKLEQLGLESAYHTVSKEAFGHESMPTFFRYWREELGHHVDYVFASRGKVRSAYVGRFSEWTGSSISDHVPVVADIAL